MKHLISIFVCVLVAWNASAQEHSSSDLQSKINDDLQIQNLQLLFEINRVNKNYIQDFIEREIWNAQKYTGANGGLRFSGSNGNELTGASMGAGVFTIITGSGMVGCEQPLGFGLISSGIGSCLIPIWVPAWDLEKAIQDKNNQLGISYKKAEGQIAASSRIIAARLQRIFSLTEAEFTIVSEEIQGEFIYRLHHHVMESGFLAPVDVIEMLEKRGIALEKTDLVRRLRQLVLENEEELKILKSGEPLAKGISGQIVLAQLLVSQLEREISEMSGEERQKIEEKLNQTKALLQLIEDLRNEALSKKDQ